VALDLRRAHGTPLEQQRFTWRELAPSPYSKLDDDAFTRLRVLLVGALESEQNRFLHALARSVGTLRVDAARVRRIEHHQQLLVRALHPADQSVLETTIAIEQAQVEVGAAIAQEASDPALAAVARATLLEDLDHLFRFAALLDRVEGQDANHVLQSYTDLIPGRPTARQHRAPEDDVRRPWGRGTAPAAQLGALVLAALGGEALGVYATLGPSYPDPLGRQLFAEIASVEEQHVTELESLFDPGASWLERWLLHELAEVWCCWSAFVHEGDRRLRALFERFLDYELGHLAFVKQLVREHERRDPEELLPDELPDPILWRSQRDFVRAALAGAGARDESVASRGRREALAAAGSPSEAVAAGWTWHPGGELAALRRAG